MATYSKIFLSGSTNGLAIPVAATGTAGTTIHTAHATAIDEIWLYATNDNAASPIVSVKITVEWGEAAAYWTQNIPPNGMGMTVVAPGLLLSGGLSVKIFAASTTDVFIYGYVNRITA